jgi:hypothetical protein
VSPEHQRWQWLHRGAALLVCVIVPGWTWLDGTRSLAWTMYCRSATYRLTVLATDADGHRRFVAPNKLAAAAAYDVQNALSGAERFRRGPSLQSLREQLPGLAKLACTVSQASGVKLKLESKADLDAPVQVSVVRAQCTESTP